MRKAIISTARNPSHERNRNEKMAARTNNAFLAGCIREMGSLCSGATCRWSGHCVTRRTRRIRGIQTGLCLQFESGLYGRYSSHFGCRESGAERFFGVDRDYPVQDMKYGNEVKVTEDGRDYWMPVSFDVLTDMQKKLKQGEAFTAYVRLLGESGNRWIFLLDGFSSASRKPWIRLRAATQALPCGWIPDNPDKSPITVALPARPSRIA